LPVTDLLGTAREDQRAGRFQQAEAGYRRLLQVEPNHPEALRSLGRLAQQAGKGELALALVKKAAATNPADAICHEYAGNVLMEQGKVSQAVAFYLQAIALKPDHAEAHNNLGIALKALGKLDHAHACFQRAIAHKPDYAAAHNNLGLVFYEIGQLDQAAASYNNAIALQADYSAAYYNLGVVHSARNNFDQAAVCFRKASSIDPNYTEALNNLGIALWKLGKLDEASACYNQAITQNPEYAEAYNNLALVLCGQGQPGTAFGYFAKAISLKPDYAEAYYNFGSALKSEGRLDEAIANLTRAIALRPDFVEAHNNLGIALQPLDKVHEAYACFQRALSLKPDFALAYNNLLFTHAFLHDTSMESQLAMADGWEKAMLSESDRQAAAARRYAFLPRTDGKLKLGIVSAELGQHAVAEFLQPILEELDRRRLHITLFPTVLRSGPRAARLRQLADQWIPLAGIADAPAAAQIRAQQIDILIDTTGHTQACRLGIFAHRAAPVQCHYIGQCGTTGLTEMDWFIADHDLLPSSCDAYYRERIWRLPRLWLAYRGDTSLPESGWKPDEGGVIWLGSFNNLEKVRQDTCRLWAKVMNVLPESKLLLKDRMAMSDLVRQRILGQLAGHGIESGRVEFAGRTPDWTAHMAMYDRLDLALDPIPLNSGTTAFDALWMGVPLVSLEGDRMGGRMSGTILRALGKPEWVVRSEEQYVATVVALARDVEGRRALRARQRSLMAASPLCDAKGLARALEEAFAAMVGDWAKRREACCGQPTLASQPEWAGP